MTEPKYVKVRFAPGETGWAVDLGDNKYKIANVPLQADIGFGDIVTYDGDPWDSSPILLEKCFPKKGSVRYTPQTQEKYIEVRKFAEQAEKDERIALEAAVPGIIMMDFKADFDPEAFFKGCQGVEVSFE